MLKQLLELISGGHEKLYKEAIKTAKNETYLREITEIVRNSLYIDEIIAPVCRKIPEIFNVQRVVITDFTKKDDGKFHSYHYNTHKEIKNSDNLPALDQEKTYGYAREIIIEKGDNFVINNLLESDVPEDYKKIVNKLGVKSALGVPIKNDDRCWGGLFIVDCNECRYWTDEELNLLKTIANKISIAIRQADLFEKAQKQAERETLLRKIFSAISSTLDINDLKNKIVTEIGRALNADKCGIFEYDSNSNKFFTLDEHSQYLSSDEIPDYTGINLEEEELQPFRNIYLSGKDLYTPDTDNLPENTHFFMRNFYKEAGIKSNYTVRITYHGELLGILYLNYLKQKRDLLKEDPDLLKILSDQAGIALYQARLYAQTKKQAERESFLRKINETISGTLDLDKVLSLVCQEMLKFFNTDRVAIGKYESSEDITKAIKVTEAIANKNIPRHKNATLVAKVNEYLNDCLLKKGGDLIINNMEDENIPTFYREFHKQLGTKSILNVAIKKGKENWGIMALFHNKEHKHWTLEEIDLMHAVSEQVFIAIRQAELYTKSQEAVRLKSEFIANISHEIRTPLNSILGFSQLLDNPNCTKEKHTKYINNISLSANNLLKLVNSILDFSKIESGKMFLCLEEFNSANAIREAISSIKSIAIQKNITIDTELSDVILDADIIKFNQIMINLLSNAIKFTNENGLITIRTKCKNHKLTVEVEDNGIGIAKEDRDKIFEYFNQIDSPYVRSQEGSGLGLVLIKKLVELHNGTISFESKKGKGSKFWFTLPKTKNLLEQKNTKIKITK